MQGIIQMITQLKKRLPKELNMQCYACEKDTAVFVCRYKVGEMMIQVCLCEKCMQIDTERLLKHTLGIDLDDDETRNHEAQAGQETGTYRRSLLY